MSERATRLRHHLVNELERHGWLTSPGWRAAFRAVPRHAFLPRYFRLTDNGRRYRAVGADDPDWLADIYHNTVLPTQLDGDDSRWQHACTRGPVDGVPTCSSTQPSLMAVMLEALDVHDGHRVLEIGTGTGYNTALLCHRLGADNVTSVDVDPGLADSARLRLAALGYAPTVVAGNGTDGCADRAPYDRLIVTCAVGTVPPAWLTQVRPGGTILTSLHRDLGGGLLVRLVVDDRGEAHGHLLDDTGYFMPNRSQPAPRTVELIQAAATATGEISESRLSGPLPDDSEPWYAIAALQMPDVARLDLHGPRGLIQWLVHPDGSWAYYDASLHTVEQGGPRHLWTKMADVCAQWGAPGAPRRSQVAVRVTAADPEVCGSGWHVRAQMSGRAADGEV